MKTFKLSMLIIFPLIIFSCAKDNQKTITNTEKKFSYIIDDLLIYNSHDELKNAGFKINKGTINMPNQPKRYFSTIYSPDKATVKFNWIDSLSQLKSVTVSNNNSVTKWKTRSGHSPNTSYEEWKTLNGKVIKIGPFEMNKRTVIDWNGGNLEDSKIEVTIVSNDKWGVGDRLALTKKAVLINDPMVLKENFKTLSLTLLKN